MYGTKDISGSIDVSNHHSTHVLTYLARMARFYDERFSNSPNSFHRDRTRSITSIQANF